MRSVGILLIVACLIADMATPLCPGAFRFDPAESIEGVGSRAVATRPPHIDAAKPEHDGPNPGDARGLSPTAGDRVAPLPIRPMLPRAALGSTAFDLGSARSRRRLIAAPFAPPIFSAVSRTAETEWCP